MPSATNGVVSNLPPAIVWYAHLGTSAPAFDVAFDNPALTKARTALGEEWGKKALAIGSGGSIPIVGDFATHLGIPTVLMGFGLPDDGLHSPNEKYRVENYYKGIMTIAHFFEEYGK